MPVQSRLPGARAVGLLPPPRESRHAQALASRERPNAHSRFDTIEAGHAEVHEDHVEFGCLGNLDRLEPVVGYPRLVTLKTEEFRERGSYVFIVINDEN